MRAEAACDDYFDAPTEQRLQLLDQRQIIAEATVLCQIDQQVDVAVRALVAADRGAELTQAGCPMLGSDRANGITLTKQLFTQRHRANLHVRSQITRAF